MRANSLRLFRLIGLFCLCLAGAPLASQPLDPGRSFVMKGLADPEVAFDGNRYLLTGTWSPGRARVVKIWTSPDLDRFDEAVIYDPSKADPAHGYCRIWAPDISFDAAGTRLTFSATRFDRGGDCPNIGPLSGAQVTTFIATSPPGELAFGPPRPINAGGALPRTHTGFLCPPEGCNHAIRIDGTTYRGRGGDWFFYTWFERGNNISAYRLDRPGQVRDILRPFSSHGGPFGDVTYEERVNEAPDAFMRGGRSYLVYSRGDTHRSYGLSYLMSDDSFGFAKDDGVHSLSTPVFAESGAGCIRARGRPNYRRAPLLENLGHSAVAERDGTYYIFYHVGRWKGPGCEGFRRDTYRQALRFRPDGTLESLTDLYLTWPRNPGARYALELRLKDGRRIAPCVGADMLGSAGAYRFTGTCPSASGADRIVHKSEIESVSLIARAGGVQAGAGGANARRVAYDGGEYLSLAAPGARQDVLAVTWTGTGRREEAFSLDLVLTDGSRIAGCLGPEQLATGHAARLTGACPGAPGRPQVSPGRIAEIRLCSAAPQMRGISESTICIRTPVHPGVPRVHVDMGGG